MLDSHGKYLLAFCIALVSASFPNPAMADPSPPLAVSTQADPDAPRRTMVLHMADMAQGQQHRLWGRHPAESLEFTLRRDQVVESAALNLVFTPSPVLEPRLSHLRVYLNEELMGVIPVEPTEQSLRQTKTVTLDPRVMTRFNRLRLEFVGHYKGVCEDEQNSALWLDISRDTSVRIVSQALRTVNDLAFFPEPFFDVRDMSAQSIPLVFPAAPSSDQLRAGAILSSYFGSLSKWRRARIPVHYGSLPVSNAVVFATNHARPGVLAGYPRVDGPTVAMISHPSSPYFKLLLILGRDTADLVTAASALAIGNMIFRGQSVQVKEVQQLAPRMPYDAPNWAPVDRPVALSELLDYPEQLDVSGMQPRPILVSLNLPPDLFVWRNSGIPTAIRYRYSSPRHADESRLSLSLNGRFVNSYLLHPQDSDSGLARLRLAVRGSENVGDRDQLVMPALKLGGENQLRFDFSFAGTGAVAGQDQPCQILSSSDFRATIDEQSTMDFSGFHHYLEMPNLRSFAGSGFPFSKMADLSETVVVLPRTPTAAQAQTLFETLAGIGSQVGYPALGVRVSHDWNVAQNEDADLLLIGSTPDSLKARPDARLLMLDARSALQHARQSRHADAMPSPVAYTRAGLRSEREATSRVMVNSVAPMAAIVGMQSTSHPQRSVVALLGTTDEDFLLLRDALSDSGKRDVMRGSVVIIRESGVSSEMVGPHYYVGHLPWWQKVWFALSDQPFALLLGSLLSVLTIAVLLWIGLYRVARRRLQHVD